MRKWNEQSQQTTYIKTRQYILQLIAAHPLYQIQSPRTFLQQPTITHAYTLYIQHTPPLLFFFLQQVV